MNNLIKNAIEYYDFKHILMKNISYKKENIKTNNKITDLQDNIFIYKNKKDNKSKKLKYEILGKIDEDNKILTWSWSLSEISKNKSYISKSLLNYGLDLNDDNLLELKDLLINSKIKYYDINSLDIILILCLFLTKSDACEIIDEYVYIFYDIQINL